MDLRQLRTFVAVVDEGTVSNAAELLHTAQPALSRQIADLEEELGVKLFERVRRRLVLTSEGEQLLVHSRGVLDAAGSLRERALQMRRGDTGILHVAATPQTIEGVFATFVGVFATRRPGVQVKLTEAVGPALLQLLERGQVHLSVGLTGLLQAHQSEHAAIQSLELARLDFLGVFGRAWKPPAGNTVDIGELARFPLLVLDASFHVRTIFDAACRIAGVQPRLVMQSRTPHALLAFAEAGHGVAVVPSVLPTRRYRVRVKRITHRGRALQDHLALLWHRKRVLPAYAADFSHALAEHTRSLFAAGPAFR